MSAIKNMTHTGFKIIIGLFFIILFSASIVPADDNIPECPQCSQEVYSAWWEYCPRCGAKLPRFKISLSDLLQDETITGNIYFNKPYNFKIERPSEEWKILTGSQAAQYNSDTVVVMEDKLKKSFAMVIVDKLTELSLEDYFNLIKPVEDKNIREAVLLSRHKTTVNDNESLRAEFEIKMSGADFRFVYHLFGNDEQKFQVVMWSAKKDYVNAQESFDLIKDSFDFIDKEPVPSGFKETEEVKSSAGQTEPSKNQSGSDDGQAEPAEKVSDSKWPQEGKSVKSGRSK